MQWVSTQSAWLLCPKCSAGMKLRTAQRGRYAGRDFWGCRNYPSCNEIVNIKPVPEMQKPAVAAPPLASLPGRPQSALPPEELERLRERTRRATAESAAYIAAELARAKQRRRRRSR
ncbi:topoisomerase DNA-binding C4 zinc finger domain-containing protein [Mesorhizobium sp.]|uniref:topoisomerase DNA-binding C4 zinc finger domain-containing protein n=1 Tax=Mesorhizobium sp. TaxID=1871066 RepID=UPI0034541269